MKAWSMFVHSLRLVINNLDVALRVSLVLYSVQAISQIYTFSANSGEMVQGPDGIPYPDISAGEGFVMLLLGIAALLASLWIAVAWHRYVLLGEEPAGWLPNWPGAAIPGYLWRSVLLGLVVALAAVPVGAISAVILPPVLMLAVTVGVASFVFFRLSPILPAIALGNSLGFREAWEATRGEAGTIVGLAGLMILGSLALQIPTMLSGDPNSPLSLVYSIVVGWFATMIGISLLTTVYGHCVEGRGVD
ncbi:MULTISPECIES: hypothetical protein [Marinovum]|uniref:hypothetical protein n=1 Tax=Marinovum TaxID=367771 RepID=UPI00237C373E|nr:MULTISPECIES: hypothetical protein [Marinovum]MDD9738243.1 hypothetical protein [Marinovum sp. SP66]